MASNLITAVGPVSLRGIQTPSMPLSPGAGPLDITAFERSDRAVANYLAQTENNYRYDQNTRLKLMEDAQNRFSQIAQQNRQTRGAAEQNLGLDPLFARSAAVSDRILQRQQEAMARTYSNYSQAQGRTDYTAYAQNIGNEMAKLQQDMFNDPEYRELALAKRRWDGVVDAVETARKQSGVGVDGLSLNQAYEQYAQFQNDVTGTTPLDPSIFNPDQYIYSKKAADEALAAVITNAVDGTDLVKTVQTEGFSTLLTMSENVQREVEDAVRLATEAIRTDPNAMKALRAAGTTPEEYARGQLESKLRQSDFKRVATGVAGLADRNREILSKQGFEEDTALEAQKQAGKSSGGSRRGSASSGADDDRDFPSVTVDPERNRVSYYFGDTQGQIEDAAFASQLPVVEGRVLEDAGTANPRVVATPTYFVPAETALAIKGYVDTYNGKVSSGSPEDLLTTSDVQIIPETGAIVVRSRTPQETFDDDGNVIDRVYPVVKSFGFAESMEDARTSANVQFSPNNPSGGGDIGYRNNNPLNMRPVGGGGFQRFNSLSEGFNAAVADIQAKVAGRSPALRANMAARGREGVPTLADLIETWSPRESVVISGSPGDNSDEVVDNYIQTVSQTLGVPPDTPLADLSGQEQQIARAMMAVESPDSAAAMVQIDNVTAPAGAGPEASPQTADPRPDLPPVAVYEAIALKFSRDIIKSVNAGGLEPTVIGKYEFRADNGTMQIRDVATGRLLVNSPMPQTAEDLAAALLDYDAGMFDQAAEAQRASGLRQKEKAHYEATALKFSRDVMKSLERREALAPVRMGNFTVQSDGESVLVIDVSDPNLPEKVEHFIPASAQNLANILLSAHPEMFDQAVGAQRASGLRQKAQSNPFVQRFSTN